MPVQDLIDQIDNGLEGLNVAETLILPVPPARGPAVQLAGEPAQAPLRDEADLLSWAENFAATKPKNIATSSGDSRADKERAVRTFKADVPAASGSTFGRNVSKGFLNIGETSLGFFESLTDILGASKAKSWLKEKGDRLDELNRTIPNEIQSFTDVEDAGDAGAFLAMAIGQFVPQVVPALIGGVGARALTAGASAGAKLAGTLAGTVVPSTILESGGIYRGVRDETGVEAPVTSLIFGAIAGALEAVTPSRFLLKVFDTGTDEIKRKSLASLLKLSAREILKETGEAGVRVGKAAAKTGLTELGTEIGQEAIALGANKFADGTYDLINSKNAVRLIDAGLMGLVGGAALGSVQPSVERAIKYVRKQEEGNAVKEQAKPTDEQQVRTGVDATAIVESEKTRRTLNEINDEWEALSKRFDASEDAYERANILARFDYLLKEKAISDIAPEAGTQVARATGGVSDQLPPVEEAPPLSFPSYLDIVRGESGRLEDTDRNALIDDVLRQRTKKVEKPIPTAPLPPIPQAPLPPVAPRVPRPVPAPRPPPVVVPPVVKTGQPPIPQPVPIPPQPEAKQPEAPVTNADSVAIQRIADALIAGPLTRDAVNNIISQTHGGTLASGIMDSKNLTDLVEAAVNRIVLGNAATYGPIANHTPEQALETIASLKGLLSKVPTQTTRTAEQVKFQQFSTPPPLAYVANWVANITPSDVVLEPSAGIGGLAVFAKAHGAKVLANELSGRRAQILGLLGIADSITELNAELIHALFEPKIQSGEIQRPTVVVMNPPFSSAATTDRKNTLVGAKHVEQALNLLPVGGRLVAIVGEGMALDRPTFKPWWRKIGNEYSIRANIGVSGKEYAKYGTTFGNQLIVIDKTGPTLSPIATGNVETVEELVPLLERIRNDRPRTEQKPNQPSGATPVASVGSSPRPTIPTPVDSGSGGVVPPERRTDGAERPVGGVNPEPSGSGETPGRGIGPDAGGGITPPVEPVSGEGGVRPSPEPTERVTLETQGGEKQVKLVGTDGVFAVYEPTKVKIPGSKPHPTELVESASMASVLPVDPTYTPSLPSALIKSGAVSEAQIEQVVYAGQAFEKMLPNGERQGYFIGDGTGVGKGRIIAAIIADNWRNGRRRAVWVSKGKNLINDAKRDVAALGLKPDSVIDLAKKITPIPSDKDGIAFLTYKGISTNNPGVKDGVLQPSSKANRMQTLMDWLGADYDGVIALDEVHLAGNAVAVKGTFGTKEPSQRALAIVDLQRLFPKARILYVSATGATDVTNLSYGDRLGIWGPGKPFPTKHDFFNKIQAGGLSAMEIVARDLKAMGVYLARTLSFRGVDQIPVVHPLTSEQRSLYNELSDAWQFVFANVDMALAGSGQNNNGQARGRAMGTFWGAEQRFFNQLLTALQMPTVLREIKADLADKKQIVVQLVNTNEATLNRELAEQDEDDPNLEELDLSPKDILLGYIDKKFPTQLYQPVTDEDGNESWKPVFESYVDPQGVTRTRPVQDPKAVALKKETLGRLSLLKAPQNPMEQLLDTFGVDMVAEVTGRSKRVVWGRDDQGKRARVVESRNEAMRKTETDQFNAGKRRILIFSDAGGTGFSYHSGSTFKNQEQRNHYLVQAGWRADGALQGMGRTHRADQVVPPFYKLVSTDLKGHQRFISTIARRLNQLGALTSGERKTAGAGVFTEEQNLEGPYSSPAIHSLFMDAWNGELEGFDFRELARKLGFVRTRINERSGEVETEITLIDSKTGALNSGQIPNVPRFLNRILALNVDEQNRLFDAFFQRLQTKIELAKQQGKYDPGTQERKALAIRVIKDEVAFTHESGAVTRLVDVEIDEPIKKLDWEGVSKLNIERWIQVKQNKRIYGLAEGHNVTDEHTGNVTKVWRRIGVRGHSYTSLENTDGFEEVSKDEAKTLWNSEYDKTPKSQTLNETYVVGAFLPIWDRIGLLNPRIFRLKTNKGAFLGALVPESMVPGVRSRLGAGAGEALGAQTVFRGLMAGERYNLANGWVLRRSKVLNEWRIEAVGLEWSNRKEWTDFFGGYTEQIQWTERFFIPNDEQQAVAALEKILVKAPVVPDEPRGAIGQSTPTPPIPPVPSTGVAAEMTPEEHAAHYPVVASNALVDGRVIRNPDKIANMSSIGSSLDDYEILPGIREVPMSDFTLTGRHYSVRGQNNIDNLAQAIRESGEIAPLIVVRDSGGAYVLEGATRAEALFKLGAKSFPAKVVLDLEDIANKSEATIGSIAELRKRVEESNLSTEAKAFIVAFLDSGAAKYLEGARFRIAEALDGGWEGSYFKGLVEIAETATPGVAPQEFMHRIFDLLPEADKQAIEALRQERLAELQARYPNDPLLASILAGPMTTANFVAANPTDQQITDLYPITTTDEFFAHMMSDKFVARAKGASRGLISTIREAIKDLVAAIKKGFRLPVTADEMFRNIINGRYDVTPDGGAQSEARRGAVVPITRQKTIERVAAFAKPGAERQTEALLATGQVTSVRNILDRIVTAIVPAPFQERVNRFVGFTRMDAISTYARDVLGQSPVEYRAARAQLTDEGQKNLIAVHTNRGHELFEQNAVSVRNKWEHQQKKLASPAWAAKLRELARRRAKQDAVQSAREAVELAIKNGLDRAVTRIRESGGNDAVFESAEQEREFYETLLSRSGQITTAMESIANALGFTPDGLSFIFGARGNNANDLLAFYHAMVPPPAPDPVTGRNPQFAINRVAAEILARNVTLRQRMVAAIWTEATELAKPIKDLEDQIVHDMQAGNPRTVIGKLIRQAGNMNRNEGKAAAAFLVKFREVTREVELLEALDAAVAVIDATLADPQYRAVRTEVATDAKAEVRPQAAKALELAEPFYAKSHIYLPDGTIVELNMFPDKVRFDDELNQKLDPALTALNTWLFDAANIDHPSRGFYQQQYNLFKDLWWSNMAVNPPKQLVAFRNLTFKVMDSMLGMLGPMLQNIGTRSTSLAQTALAVWESANHLMGDWLARWNPLIVESIGRATKSHPSISGGQTRGNAAKEWHDKVFSPMAAREQDPARPGLKVGDVIPESGEVVTQQDLDALHLQVAATRAAHEVDVVAGRKGLAIPNLVEDRYVPGLKFFRGSLAFAKNMIMRRFDRDGIHIATAFAELKTKIAPLSPADQRRALINFWNDHFDYVKSAAIHRNAQYSNLTDFEAALETAVPEIANGGITTVKELVDFVAASSTTTEAEIEAWLFGELDRHATAITKATASRKDLGILEFAAIENQNPFTVGRGPEVAPPAWYSYGFTDSPSIYNFSMSGGNFYFEILMKSLNSVSADMGAEISRQTTEEKRLAQTLGTGGAAQANLRQNQNDIRFGRQTATLEDLTDFQRGLDKLILMLNERFSPGGKRLEEEFGLANKLLSNFTSGVLASSFTLARNALEGGFVQNGFRMSRLFGSTLQGFPRAFLGLMQTLLKVGGSGLLSLPIAAGKVLANVPAATGTFFTTGNLLKAEHSLFGTAMREIATTMYERVKMFRDLEELGLGMSAYPAEQVQASIQFPLTFGQILQEKGVATSPFPRLLQTIGPALFSWYDANLNLFIRPVFSRAGDQIANLAVANATLGGLHNLEARLRKLFSVYRDAGVPIASLSNHVFTPSEILGKWFGMERSQTNLREIQQWFHNSLIPLNESVFDYLTRLETDPKANWLTPEEKMRLIVKNVEEVNVATPSNRPIVLRKNLVMRAVGALLGWNLKALRNAIHNFTSIAASDPKFSQTQLQIATYTLVLATLAWSALGQAGIEEILRFLGWTINRERRATRQPWEQEGLDQAKQWTVYGFNSIPFVATAVNMMFSDLPNKAGFSPTLLVQNKIIDVLNYVSGAIRTRDITYRLPQLVRGFIPFAPVVLNRLPATEGTVEAMNASRLYRRYGDLDLIRRSTGGPGASATATRLTPYGDRILNALAQGDYESAEAIKAEAVKVATSLGKADPERSVEQSIVSRLPHRRAFKETPNAAQMARVMAKMSSSERAQVTQLNDTLKVGLDRMGVKTDFVDQPRLTDAPRSRLAGGGLRLDRPRRGRRSRLIGLSSTRRSRRRSRFRTGGRRRQRRLSAFA